MLDQYNKTSKNMISMFKEGGLDVEIRASQRDDNLFFYLVPISNHADIDSLYRKLGKDREMLWNSLLKTLKNFEHYNGHLRRDISILKEKM